MAVSLLTITSIFEPEGICYGVAESHFRLVVAPKRKNRWACTLYSGENVLDVAILDPTDKTQRERFLKTRDLSNPTRSSNSGRCSCTSGCTLRKMPCGGRRGARKKPRAAPRSARSRHG